jgi:D-alanyl-D-alanine carboxypeptidase
MQLLKRVPDLRQNVLLICGTFVLITTPVNTLAISPPALVQPETVRIGDAEFEIPEPWIGNKIQEPSIGPSKFIQIPVDHTKDGTQLYLRENAHAALLELLEAAQQDGITLRVESGYRSQGYQKKIFVRMLNEGRDFDDIIRYVAPPGYSQHALGTAVDFFPSNWQFASLADYEWLRENGADFGFTETYSKNNALRYPWEAWHWNYTEKD